jgi:putative two-component system hydrogenase maturation factor HypX/HoxX
VWARRGVVLNPHYKNMGNLYGSEYWSYLLPRRVGSGRRPRDHAQPPAAWRGGSRGRWASSTSASVTMLAGFEAAEVATRRVPGRIAPTSPRTLAAKRAARASGRRGREAAGRPTAPRN